jgi:hypothetical protein
MSRSKWTEGNLTELAVPTRTHGHCGLRSGPWLPRSTAYTDESRDVMCIDSFEHIIPVRTRSAIEYLQARNFGEKSTWNETCTRVNAFELQWKVYRQLW